MLNKIIYDEVKDFRFVRNADGIVYIDCALGRGEGKFNQIHWNKMIDLFKSKSNKCTRCESIEKLQLHHWTYVNLGNEKEEELELLCIGCHLRIHRNIENLILNNFLPYSIDNWVFNQIYLDADGKIEDVKLFYDELDSVKFDICNNNIYKNPKSYGRQINSEEDFDFLINNEYPKYKRLMITHENGYPFYLCKLIDQQVRPFDLAYVKGLLQTIVVKKYPLHIL